MFKDVDITLILLATAHNNALIYFFSKKNT